MTATERLRAMLDERGVEWTEPNNDERSRTTYWTADVFSCIAVEFTDGVVSVSLTAHRITPEQAIEATLGRGECREVENEFGYTTCSECGAVLPEDYTVYYCWNCGRKVRA